MFPIQEGKASRQTVPTDSRLQLTQPVFDFGPVPRNQALRHAFKYGVSSADTLHILDAHSTCRCAFARLPENPLLPGDTGIIEATYKTGLAEGPFQQSLEILTNSTKTPKVALTLKGTVVRCVYPDPPLISLDEAQVGSAWTQDIKIHWRRWKQPGFRKVKVVPGFLVLDGLNRDKADTGLWHLGIRLSGKAVARYYQDTLILPTSDSAWPAVKIPIQGTPSDVVTAKPLVVNFGDVKTGRKVSGSFLLLSSLAGMQVEDVKTTSPHLLAQAGPSEEGGRRIRVNLSTEGTPEPGSIGTEILVRVKAGEVAREIKVPVVGRFVE